MLKKANNSSLDNLTPFFLTKSFKLSKVMYPIYLTSMDLNALIEVKSLHCINKS